MLKILGIIGAIIVVGFFALAGAGWIITQQTPGQLVERSLGAGGDLIFNDLFTEGSDTELSLHTPDTGTSWTQVYNKEGDDSLIVESSSNNLRMHGSDASAGAHYTADSTYPSANYGMQMTMTTMSSAQDDMILPAIRGTDGGGSISAGYTVDDLSNHGGDNPQLARITGTISCTVMKTLENGQSVSYGAVLDNGDELLLTAYNDDIAAFNLTEYINIGYEEDGNITGTGEAYIIAGSRPCDITGDFASGHRVDNVQVIEYGASTTDWANPTTNGEVHTDWSNPGNAYASDNSDASALNDANGGQFQDYGDFGFSSTDVETVRGIMVRGEFGCSSADYCVLEVSVSNDNGSTWSTIAYKALMDGTTDDYYQWGHADELWGLTWTASDITDTDLRIRVEHAEGQDTGTDIFLDHIQVQVIYDPGAGEEPPVATSTGAVGQSVFVF